jgi:hypothetical protein
VDSDQDNEYKQVSWIVVAARNTCNIVSVGVGLPFSRVVFADAQCTVHGRGLPAP